MSLEVGQTQVRRELANWNTSQKKSLRIKHRENEKEKH